MRETLFTSKLWWGKGWEEGFSKGGNNGSFSRHLGGLFYSNVFFGGGGVVLQECKL